MIELVSSLTFPTQRIMPVATLATSEANQKALQSTAGLENVDTVELGSSLRSAKLRAVRDEIATGAYETSERIEATVNRLLDLIA